MCDNQAEFEVKADIHGDMEEIKDHYYIYVHSYLKLCTLVTDSLTF